MLNRLNTWQHTLRQKVQTSFAALHGQQPRFAGRLDDLAVKQARLVFDDGDGSGSGRLRCLWYELAEQAAGGEVWHGYRVVKLAELRYLPQEARSDPALIQKATTLLRGLYAANVELVVLDYGIFDPPIGVVQCYGVAARHATLEGAQQIAEGAYQTLVGTFTSQFPQSRLEPLSGDRARWLFDALHHMPHITALVGSPDPREAARGGQQQQGLVGGTQGTIGFTQQQNELLFRAMARANEEFCFINLATPIGRRDIALMLTALGDLASPIASRQQGTSSIGFGMSLPMLFSAGQAQTAGQNYGTSESEGQSDSMGAARGISHSEGVARTAGWAYTEGAAHTDGHAATDSVTHTTGTSHSVSVSDGTSHATGSAHTESSSNSSGVSSSASSTTGSAENRGININVGAAFPKTGSGGGLFGLGKGGNGFTPSAGGGVSYSQTASEASTTGMSFSEISTHGSADTTSVSDSTSHGVTVSSGSFESTSTGHAETKSEADTKSSATTVSGAVTRSEAEAVSQTASVAHADSRAAGVSLGRSLGAAQSLGLTTGVAPSVSVSKSFVWKDEVAVMVTQLLEEQLNLLRNMSEGGGLYSDVYILTRTECGRQVAEASAVQAFGGTQGVVTHLQPRRPLTPAEAAHLVQHAQCFSPSTLTETLGWVNGYAYASLLTMEQQAAYTAPGLFEEGPATTTQERTPPFSFQPEMAGDAVLGHLYSTERGQLTRARLAIGAAQHFHTVFAGDTGMGKTVAAERLATEAVNRWQHRVIVLDFGAGWRRLVNGPLPRERVDLYQLFPGALRPLRWNFLRIGRRLQPDRQYLATAELLANAGRMGPRQLGFIRRALRELYERHGVLTSDKQVLTDPAWNCLRSDEELDVLSQAALERGLPPANWPRGANLLSLQAFERQALAVHRSRQTDVVKLYEILAGYLKGVKDQASRQSLEGVLLRLEPFTQGELALMYGGGGEGVAIEDLGLLGPEADPSDRWGICILEGGAEMDEYSKITVLSLVAWHLYNDSVIRRRETIGGFNRPLDIFWEEANKLLSGTGDTTGSSDNSGSGGSPPAIQQWQTMWRDGRKYSIFLHPLVQTVSELPPGILASCNNAFFGQMKNLRDRDMAMGHLARSERGFTDEEYKRFLSRIPHEQMIVKLGWNDDVVNLEPMWVRALRVSAREPTDAEILQKFGALRDGSG